MKLWIQRDWEWGKSCCWVITVLEQKGLLDYFIENIKFLCFLDASTAKNHIGFAFSVLFGGKGGKIWVTAPLLNSAVFLLGTRKEHPTRQILDCPKATSRGFLLWTTVNIVLYFQTQLRCENIPNSCTVIKTICPLWHLCRLETCKNYMKAT